MTVDSIDTLAVEETLSVTDERKRKLQIANFRCFSRRLKVFRLFDEGHPVFVKTQFVNHGTEILNIEFNLSVKSDQHFTLLNDFGAENIFVIDFVNIPIFDLLVEVPETPLTLGVYLFN